VLVVQYTDVIRVAATDKLEKHTAKSVGYSINFTSGFQIFYLYFFIFVSCIFIMLIFFYQQVQFYLTYKILKFTLKSVLM